MAKALWYIFGGSIIMGFFLAIFIMTGTNIEPNDLMFTVIDSVVQAFQTIGINIPFWGAISVMIAILGLIGTIIGILRIVSYGWKGVIVTLSGFFGCLLLLLGGGHVGLIIIGLIFILIGFIICSVVEGDAPEDFIRNNI